jgi:dCTP diphosphatase
MNSSDSALEPALLIALREFVEERDWAQFHSPENLAKSISIESAELLERFQWNATSTRNMSRLSLLTF